MSLLNRIKTKGGGNSQKPPKPGSLLQQLFYNLKEANILQSQIDKLIADNRIHYTQQKALKDDPIEFLVNDLNLVQQKDDLLALLIEEISKRLNRPEADFTPESFRSYAKPIFDSLIYDLNLKLGSEERQNLWEGIVSEYIGLGPLDKLIADGSIHEIVVMSYRSIYVCKHEKMETVADTVFKDDIHYQRIIDRIFPYSEAEMKLPVRSTNLSRNVRAICFYQGIEGMNPKLTIYKQGYR